MGNTLALVRNLLFVVAVGLFLQLHGLMTPAHAVSVISAETALRLETNATPSTEYCGDDICQSDPCSNFLEPTPGDGCLEDPNNCPEDCSECGDGICNLSYETQSSCPDDCGVCGDGVCSTFVEANRYYVFNWCEPDCGPPPGPIGQACTDDSECNEGERCNSQNICVRNADEVTIEGETCGGSCSSTSEDCCGRDICYGNPGADKYCAAPDVNACAQSEECSSIYDCYNAYACPYWSGGQGGGGCHKMYCNPAYGRCGFLGSPDCPTTENVMDVAPFCPSTP